jgi:hypothetical protein
VTKLIWLLLLSLLVSCVGTIEEKKTTQESYVAKKKSGIVFKGGEQSRSLATSHRKVDIAFKPAKGGSGNFDYFAYVNNQAYASSALPMELVKVDGEGFAHIIIDNLNKSFTYSIIVKAQDRLTSLQDDNQVAVILTTLSYEVPLFDGIINVINMAGIAATNQLKIFWNQAVKAAEGPGGFSANPHEISGYMIYYRKDSETNWSTQQVPDPEATNYILQSLDENTLYHLKVTALSSHSPAREDKNNTIISISTLTEQAIEFEGIASAEVPKDATGFNNIIVNWDPGLGAFDRYRIFYTTNNAVTTINPALHSNPVNGDGVQYLDVTELDLSSYQFFVPNSNTLYYVAVVACSDGACTDFGQEGANKVLPVETAPPVAPFNGINSIDVSIDSITLNWLYLPDSALGAYDTYEVTVSYNGITEVITTSSATVKLQSSPQVSSKSLKVINVTEGVQYCFKVKSAITQPDTTLRIYENNTQFCGTPTYTKPPAPQFKYIDNIESPGTLTACQNRLSSGFTLKWNPVNTGTYSQFAVYIQSGISVDYNQPFDYLIPYDSNATEYVKAFPGLVAGSTYSVGVRTYYQHPVTSEIKYGLESQIITCNTIQEKLIPQGWTKLMAFGAKQNGTDSNSTIPEAMAVKGENLLDGTPVPYNVPVNFDTLYNESPTPVTASMNGLGMVHLQWNDFKYVNGDLFTVGVAATNVGYIIYRMEYDQALHASSPPTRNSAGWVALNDGEHVQADQLIINGSILNLAQYTDYNLNMYSADKTTARVFWYKVEPFINSSQIDLNSNNPSIDYKDYIVKIIIPPANMALMHRWMVNQDTCKRLNRTIDRNNHYRCLYNGVTSTSIGGVRYYDVKGHSLMDRYELSCNFSRGRCNNAETSTVPGGVGVNDCIGKNVPTAPAGGFPNLNDAVWWNRKSFQMNTCQISVSGNTFQEINNSGVPLAKKLLAVSNSANLPPLQGMSQSVMGEICRGMNVNIVAKNNTTVRNYTKRLPRKEEFVAAMGRPLESEITNQAENGVHPLGCNQNYSQNEQHYFSWPNWSGSITSHAKHNGGEHGHRWGQVNLNHFRYPVMTQFDAAGDYSKSFGGPIFAGGSQGTGSTSMCTGLFGIQDLLGNRGAEWANDQIYCTSLYNCTMSATTGDTQYFTERLTNNDGQVLNFRDTGGNSIGLPLTYSYYTSTVHSVYWFYAVQINAFTVAESDFFSVPLGIPLMCSGTACAGKSDDNALVTRKASHPTNRPDGITNFSLDSDAGINQYMGSVANYNTTNLTYMLGGFATADAYGYAANQVSTANSSSGRNSFAIATTTATYKDVGGRCAVQIRETSDGNLEL